MRLNLDFDGNLRHGMREYGSQPPNGTVVMLGSVLMRRASSVLSALFGGLGVYFLYASVFVDPTQLVHALILLGSAVSLVWSSQRYGKGPTKRL